MIRTRRSAVIERREGLGEQARGRFDRDGRRRRLERAEQPAVPGQLGLAPQVGLDEREHLGLDALGAVDELREQVGDVVIPHGRTSPTVDRESSSSSRRRLRPRWSRTFAAVTEMPSSSAIASWGSP